VLAALAFLLLGAQARGQAQAQDALPFSQSYLLTGNYVVGSVDFDPRTASGGFLTSTIAISGVPESADILAAFLYLGNDLRSRSSRGRKFAVPHVV
jgi:hypothetical protein